MLKDQIWPFLPSTEFGVQKSGSGPAYAIGCIIPEQPLPSLGLSFLTCKLKSAVRQWLRTLDDKCSQILINQKRILMSGASL